ncbi:hypothetical protein Tco_1526324, partial [Tanacetum coccineum]
LMVVESEVLNDFPRFVGILIAEFAAAGAVNPALKMKGDMIVKKLDLKPTIDAMMRDFLYPSRWKELSKETSNGIRSNRYHVIPYGELDGIPVALVARFGVISKSADRILVSYGD